MIAVNLFVEEAVQERILDVKLMHRPVVSGGKMKHREDSFWLDDRGEGLVEVQAGVLREAMDNPTRLASLQ